MKTTPIARGSACAAYGVLLIFMWGCAPGVLDDMRLKEQYPQGEFREALLRRWGKPKETVLVKESSMDASFERAIKRIESECHERVVRCDLFVRPRPEDLLPFDKYINEDYVGYDENDRVIGVTRHVWMEVEHPTDKGDATRPVEK